MQTEKISVWKLDISVWKSESSVWNFEISVYNSNISVWIGNISVWSAKSQCEIPQSQCETPQCEKAPAPWEQENRLHTSLGRYLKHTPKRTNLLHTYTPVKRRAGLIARQLHCLQRHQSVDPHQADFITGKETVENVGRETLKLKDAVTAFGLKLEKHKDVYGEKLGT